MDKNKDMLQRIATIWNHLSEHITLLYTHTIFQSSRF